MEHFKDIPVQLLYVILATVGGAARYLNEYKNSKQFSLAIFVASSLAAGFSGLMFALVGDSLSLPNPMPHIMAGVGGFFGDQTMKLVLEYASRNVSKPKE